jgi:Carboxypeptidase regulatory-like domain/TonB-dependent Receptor Plug Domain
MRVPTVRLLALAAMVAAIVSLGSPAAAQQYTGRIDVSVEDSTGGRLPGVTVDLSGQMIQSAVTDARGEAHFLNLTVGNYNVKATLTGFNEWKSPQLLVQAGVSVPLTIKMSVAGAKEEVVVTAEAPVLDTKKETTGVSVNLDELQNVPTARDPWVVMQSVPGVVMDRVNIGGSESGQQSGFMTKGASSSDTTWNVDGMPITDMSSMSSPFYFDFDMFQEMSFTTGGADAKSATGGMQLNMMLRSGTNTFHGQAKGYLEDPKDIGWMQSSNMPADLAKALGSKTGAGDKTISFTDWGGDLGGPILKDKWWFWGAYGQQDIRIQKMTGVNDRTFLKNVSFKTNAQVTKSLRASFTYFTANKQKWGRNAGATCDQNCSEDQNGPNQMYKGEVNYNFGSNLFLVGRFAHIKGGFNFTPEGGANSLTYYDAAGVQHGSSYTYVTDRPQDSFVVDGNYFKGNHEIKFGFSWRRATTNSTTTWGQDYYSIADFNSLVTPGAAGYPYMGVQITPPYASNTQSKYMNLYVGDTISLKRMTINAGIRFDHQAASVLPATSAAPITAQAPAMLPAITAPGVNNALVYNLVQPRAGVTYSLTEDRKTQLRATYSMFTSQIGTGAASFLSVAQYRWFYLDAKDLNGDHIVQPNEILWNSYAAHIANGDFGGFNGSNPSQVATTINKVGSYGNPKTHEFIVGVDRELIPNLGISASYTYRRNIDYNWRPTQQIGGNGVIDGSDYTLKGYLNGTLPTGIPGSPDGTYSVPYYGLTSGIVFDPSKGTIYESRPDYHQTYKGFEITATKRMANRWMARVGFSTNSWREYFDAIDGQGNPTPTLSVPNINGGYVVSAASGSGKSSIYMTQPTYQLNANGAYQMPFDIDIGFNYQLRQGYPMPWYKSTNAGFSDPLGSTKSMLLVYPNFGAARLPAVNILDLRIGKRQKLGKATLNFDFDIFNLTNAAETLGRFYSATSTSFTQIQEITQPRIMRFGLRIQF